jgi:hypothetical protein
VIQWQLYCFVYSIEMVAYSGSEREANAPRWIKMLRKHGFMAEPAVA